MGAKISGVKSKRLVEICDSAIKITYTHIGDASITMRLRVHRIDAKCCIVVGKSQVKLAAQAVSVCATMVAGGVVRVETQCPAIIRNCLFELTNGRLPCTYAARSYKPPLPKLAVPSRVTTPLS